MIRRGVERMLQGFRNKGPNANNKPRPPNIHKDDYSLSNLDTEYVETGEGASLKDKNKTLETTNCRNKEHKAPKIFNIICRR